MNHRLGIPLVSALALAGGLIWFLTRTGNHSSASAPVSRSDASDQSDLNGGSVQDADGRTRRSELATVQSGHPLSVEVVVRWNPLQAWQPLSEGTLEFATQDATRSCTVSSTSTIDRQFLDGSTRVGVEIGDQLAFAARMEVEDSRVLIRAWMFAGILVDVPSAESPPSIEIVRSKTVQATRQSLIHPGRINEGDRRGIHESPAYLPWDEDASRPYWVRGATGPWTRVTPVESDLGGLTFHLPERCSGSLDIAVSGAERGYALRALVLDTEGAILLDYYPLVLDRKRLVGIPPLMGRVVFGYGSASFIRKHPIATFPVEVVCDEVSRVDLVLGDQSVERGFIEGTLTVPGLELLEDTGVVERIVLRALSEDPLLHAVRGFVAAQAFSEMEPAGDPRRRFQLGPLPLGQHEVEVLPFGVRRSVTVVDESGAGVDLVLPGMARARIRVLDSAGGAVAVQNLIALRAEPGSRRLVLPVSQPVPDEWEVVMPSGRVRVEVGTTQHGYTSETFHVGPGWNDLTLTVKESFARSVRLIHDGEPYRAPVDWWFHVRVVKESGDGEYENRDMQLTTEMARTGVPEIRFLFSGPGTYRLLLPKLAGAQCPDSVTLTVTGADEPLEIEVRAE